MSSKLVIGTSIVSIALAVIAIALHLQEKNDLGYYNLESVYLEFHLVKEMKERIKQEKTGLEMRIDSLRVAWLSLGSSENGLDSNAVQTRREIAKRVGELEDALLSYDEEQVARYDTYVNKQLDNYIRQYVTESGLTALINVNATTDVLTEADLNHTRRLIEYLNAHYNGDDSVLPKE